MARLNVLEYPDKRLRTRAAPVQVFDDALQALIDDMFETLYATRAIGLAATQVDVHRQVITIDVSSAASAPEVFINPRIVARGRIGRVEESCLSLPGISGMVLRPTLLHVWALDRNGTAFEREVDGLLAVCLGHEMDHLRGKLFVDYLSLFKRLRVRRQIDALRQQPASPPHVEPIRA